MLRGGKNVPSVARSKFVIATLLFLGSISNGHGWNLPNTYYQGATGESFGGDRGYVASRPENAFASHALASSNAGSWNQGQFGGGPPGSIEQTASSGFGHRPWAGDGKSVGAAGTGYNGAAGGAFQQGMINNNEMPFGTGQGFGAGYDGRTGGHTWGRNDGIGSGSSTNAGGYVGGAGSGPADSSFKAGGSGSALGVEGISGGARSATGRFFRERAPAAGEAASIGGAGPDTGAVGAFGVSGSAVGSVAGVEPGQVAGAGGLLGGRGLGNGDPSVPGTLFLGARPAVAYYGNPHGGAHPWRSEPPQGMGGYGAGRLPWHGTGYVYQVPVAHINPDGSYGFSYQTPHTTREESGDSNGHVDGNYGFHNDGAQHNFSFSAGPDVDLRTSIGQEGAGRFNQADYGPQSVHSRSRLPLIPNTALATNANDGNNLVDGSGATVGGLPSTVGRPQEPPAAGPGSWSSRNRENGGTGTNSPSSPDDNALNVLGLPRTPAVVSEPTSRDQVSRESTGSNRNPNSGNQLGVVRNTATVSSTGNTNDQTTSTVVDGDGLSTGVEVEDSTDAVNIVRGPFPYNDEGGRVRYGAGPDSGFRPSGGVSTNLNSQGRVQTLTTPGPLQSSVEQVVSRPENDPSYNFAYQTPTATRQESADSDGTVRNSFAFNNEGGRNDWQYLGGTGTGLRPIGGSVAVPNSLRTVGTSPGRTAPGSQLGGARSDGRYQFAYRTPDSEREESSDGAGNVRGSFAYNNEAGRNDLQYVAGAGSGFRPTGGSLSRPNGLASGASAFEGASASGAFGGDGRPFALNNHGGFHGQTSLPTSPGGSNAFQANGGLTTHSTGTRSPTDVPSGGFENHSERFFGKQPSVGARPQTGTTGGDSSNINGAGANFWELPPRRWNGGNKNGAFATTSGSSSGANPSSSRDVTDESTTMSFDDSQQPTTYRGFGTVNDGN